MTDDLFRVMDTLRADYERVDWSATPVGPVGQWSPSLRSALLLLHETRFPASLYWGPELTMFYNAAFVPLITGKHPAALGSPAAVVFAEAWDQVGPLMDGVMAGRGSTFVEDSLVPLERNGFLEDCYFTFSYSPVRERDGSVAGLIDIAMETTRQVVTARRLELLGALRDALAEVERASEVAGRLREVVDSRRGDLLDVELRLAELGDTTPDRATGVRIDRSGARPVAHLPVRGTDAERSAGALVMTLSESLPLDDAYLDFLRLAADVVARALTRLAAQSSERRATEAERRLSESLQRSLLGHPQARPGLAVAARYAPAADRARVGGDWYDAFVTPDGTMTAVIGDVSGHDNLAASVMAQARNLLRGIAFASERTPAGLLSALDRTLSGLDVDTLVTTVVVQVAVRPDDGPEVRDVVELCWSNAGHLPPLVVHADGTVDRHETSPSPLLGWDPAAHRVDHRCVLPAGSTLVLYTDGLIERRRTSLDDGIEWLTGELTGTATLPVEAVCDHLMRSLPAGAEDDIALLVLRNELVAGPDSVG